MSEILPSKFTAGLTLQQTVTLTAYPAPDWSLSVILRGPSVIDIAGGNDENIHTIDVAASTTSAWVPGVYWYSVRVTSGADVVEIEQGQIEVLPDLATQTAGYDARNHVEKTLAAIESVIEGRASLDQERYRINNRELYRTPMAELLRLRSQYKEELRRIRAAQKGQSLLGRQVLTRF